MKLLERKKTVQSGISTVTQPPPPSPGAAFAGIPISGKECHLFSAVFEAKVKPASHDLYGFEAAQTDWGRMLDECGANVGRMLDECGANVGRN